MGRERRRDWKGGGIDGLSATNAGETEGLTVEYRLQERERRGTGREEKRREPVYIYFCCLERGGGK